MKGRVRKPTSIERHIEIKEVFVLGFSTVILALSPLIPMGENLKMCIRTPPDRALAVMRGSLFGLFKESATENLNYR